jgi:hypothetical protein
MAREFFHWLSGADRLRIRFTVRKGKVTQLVVQYEALIEERWEAIVRYDTAHGYLHRDLYQRGRTQPTKETVPVADLNEGLNRAIDDLQRHWQMYKRYFWGETL